MKAVKVWARAILLDTVFFGLLAYGTSGGVAWAPSVFLFWMWTLTVLSIVFGLFGNRSWFPAYQPAGIRTYHVLTQLALISVLAGLGMTVLAACQFLAMVGLMSARNREPKAELAAGEGR